MINVHSKLVTEELSKIGVDSFAVFMCLVSRHNKERIAEIDIEELRSMTGLSRALTYRAIKVLIDEGFITKEQKKENGSFGNVFYRVNLYWAYNLLE